MKTITKKSQRAMVSKTAEFRQVQNIIRESKTIATKEIQDDTIEQENYELSFRSFLKMLLDHFTNGKLTAYTFYY